MQRTLVGTAVLLLALGGVGVGPSLAFRVPRAGPLSLRLRANPGGAGTYDVLLQDSGDGGAEGAACVATAEGAPGAQAPAYNSHPKFCLGDYRLFDFLLLDNYQVMEEEFFLKVLSSLLLLARCNIRLDKFGTFTIAKRKPGGDLGRSREGRGAEVAGAGAQPLDSEISQQSLASIKGMYQKTFENDPGEFMRRLDEEGIGTFEVEDLISTVTVPNCTEGDLLTFLESSVLSRVPAQTMEDLEPQHWEYHPDSSTLVIPVLVRNLDTEIRIKFPVHPGPKPFVIDGANVVLWSSEGIPGLAAECGTRVNFLVARAKVRPEAEVSERRLLVRSPENPKARITCLSGPRRDRMNNLFRLLEKLAANLPPAPRGAAAPAAAPRPRFELDHVAPVNLKTLTFQVNSEFRFFMPLLTYVDLATGRAYLCSNSFPIEASPASVWPLCDDSYARYHARFFPPEYANAGLFSNLDMHFRDEDLLDLLASYLAVRRYASGWGLGLAVTGASGPVPDKLRLERAGPGARGPGDEVHEYIVNGDKRLIFKNGPSGILANLLV